MARNDVELIGDFGGKGFLFKALFKGRIFDLPSREPKCLLISSKTTRCYQITRQTLLIWCGCLLDEHEIQADFSTWKMIST
jgi:hypothetical protein